MNTTTNPLYFCCKQQYSTVKGFHNHCNQKHEFRVHYQLNCCNTRKVGSMGIRLATITTDPISLETAQEVMKKIINIDSTKKNICGRCLKRYTKGKVINLEDWTLLHVPVEISPF